MMNSNTSLMKLLANRLSQQAGKTLVISRTRESSMLEKPGAQLEQKDGAQHLLEIKKSASRIRWDSRR
jgi:hypothetical protein